jgi:hypothetical protein
VVAEVAGPVPDLSVIAGVSDVRVDGQTSAARSSRRP